MKEMTKHGQVGLAAMRAGVDRKTARKYVEGGKLPSELAAPRSWRTHEDAFLEHWPELEVMLCDSPALEAKTLFEVLVAKYPGRYDDGQLRTLQRRVRSWRAERGPDKDVVLAQLHRPGEAAQTDFTWATGDGRASACPSRSRRSGTAYSARSFSSDVSPSGIRPTTRPPRRIGSRTARASPARAAASARSTRTTSRSCGTTA